jgi:hypothetical protein
MLEVKNAHQVFQGHREHAEQHADEFNRKESEGHSSHIAFADVHGACEWPEIVREKLARK